MKNKATIRILILIILFVISYAAAPVKADESKIKVSLKLEKAKLEIGYPVYATVYVRNTGAPLIVSQGFTSMDYNMQMRVINPAGQLLIARNYKPHIESPDAPPLPFDRYKGESIRVTGCEELPHGLVGKPEKADLGDYYDLSVPGEYKIEVQLSVMIFGEASKEPPCDIKKYSWLGIKKSKEKEFYIYPSIKKQADKEGLLPDRVTKNTFQIQKKNVSVLNAQNTMLASIDDVDLIYSKDQGVLKSPIGNKIWTEARPALAAQLLSARSKSNSRILLAAARVPSADMIVPAQASDVNAGTKILVEMKNVKPKTVVLMQVMGLEVYNSLSPSQHQQYTDVIGSAPSYDLIYRHWNDTRLDIKSCQHVNVMVIAYDKKKPGNQYNYQFNFRTALLADNDTDGDCLTDEDENTIFGTNPRISTLFVRPLKETASGNYEYWEEFSKILFPDPRGTAFALIQPLDQAEIEVSVIGDQYHKYPPMQESDYDPATDPNRPSCDILDVHYKAESLPPAFMLNNKGQTFFTGKTWSWDLKGMTPNISASSHYAKYKYHIAYVYAGPLDYYMTQGAYEIIDNGLAPVAGLSTGPDGELYCTEALCVESSPMNLDDNETALPFSGNPDGTVEFNEISFGVNAVISNVAKSTIHFDRNKVLRRTTVHEMGHALLSAFNSDHCANNNCIMYGAVEDWTLNDFGPGSCTHSPGESKDIRAPGVIHNSVH